jgi:hexosaminidase
MTALFPDAFFHIGGDEVDDTQWKASPSIQEFERSHNISGSAVLQAQFSLKVQEILKRRGKTMVGWDEIMQPGLDRAAVIQSWRGQETLAESAKKGYRSLLSFGYYLDHLSPAATYYANEPLSGVAAGLTAEQSALILGGEACMWSEYVNSDTVDSRIWPTMAAIAERFWSPREVSDVALMEARIDRIARDLARLGARNQEDYLDRLAGDRSAAPLRLLASVSEATGIEVRRDARHYTSLVPLDRFVDYVAPESEAVRRLADADMAQLRLAFMEWVQNDSALRAMAPGNGYLTELLPLSKNLAQTGSIGLEALSYVESRRPAPSGWVRAQTEALDRLAKPNAEVILAAVRPVRTLLNKIASGAVTGGAASQ